MRRIFGRVLWLHDEGCGLLETFMGSDGMFVQLSVFYLSCLCKSIYIWPGWMFMGCCELGEDIGSELKLFFDYEELLHS